VLADFGFAKNVCDLKVCGLTMGFVTQRFRFVFIFLIDTACEHSRLLFESYIESHCSLHVFISMYLALP
jgi:hypothetical protein